MGGAFYNAVRTTFERQAAPRTRVILGEPAGAMWGAFVGIAFARGRHSGPVPVEGVRWWRRWTGSAVWQGPQGTPHGDDRQPVVSGLEVWTGVDFSVCVVAPPGERSVGAANGKRRGGRRGEH